MCQSVTKKLSTEGSLSTSSSKLGNDGAAVEKRIRKTPEFALGQTFQENSRAYAKHGTSEDPGGISSFLMDSGILLNDLATSHVQYEIGVEKLENCHFHIDPDTRTSLDMDRTLNFDCYILG